MPARGSKRVTGARNDEQLNDGERRKNNRTEKTVVYEIAKSKGECEGEFDLKEVESGSPIC